MMTSSMLSTLEDTVASFLFLEDFMNDAEKGWNHYKFCRESLESDSKCWDFSFKVTAIILLVVGQCS